MLQVINQTREERIATLMTCKKSELVEMLMNNQDIVNQTPAPSITCLINGVPIEQWALDQRLDRIEQLLTKIAGD